MPVFLFETITGLFLVMLTIIFFTCRLHFKLAKERPGIKKRDTLSLMGLVLSVLMVGWMGILILASIAKFYPIPA